MRVEVKIPGGVEAYAVDERGDKRVATDALWLETYLCGVLRAFSYADDALNRIIGCRRFNPITSTEAEHRFLDAAERLFFKGLYISPITRPSSNRALTNFYLRLAAWFRPRSAGA